MDAWGVDCGTWLTGGAETDVVKVIGVESMWEEPDVRSDNDVPVASSSGAVEA